MSLAEELKARAEKYLYNVEEALKSVDVDRLRSAMKGLNLAALLDAVKRYLEDARYYYNKGDYLTAVAAVSYAEGLLDSLRYLGVAEVKWPERYKEPVVLVGGTFDILHPGHVWFLKEASKYGRLHVVVARDSTVVRVKGRAPLLDEESRLTVVSSIKYVYRAMLGDERDILKTVEAVRPDIIVLGPDQPFSEDYLRRELARRMGEAPEIVRLRRKLSFSRGLVSTSDLVRVICSSRC